MGSDFSHQQIGATHIEYLFYIEGMLVPIRTFSVTVSVNKSATLTVEIAPFPEAVSELKKGMKVFLFKKTNGEKDPKLRFSGYITAQMWSKSRDRRTMQLECASFDYAWSTMLLNLFDPRFVTGGNSVTFSQVRVPELDDPAFRSTYITETETKRKRYKEEISKNIKDRSMPEEDLKKLEEEISDRDYQLRNWQADNDMKQGQAILTPMADAIGALNSGYTDVVQKKNNQIGGKEVTLETNKNINTALRDAESSSAFDTDNKVIDKNIQSAFLTCLRATGNYMEAFFTSIKYAYEKSDYYSKKEFEELKLEEFFTCVDIFNPKINIDEADEKRNGLSTFANFVKKSIMKVLEGTEPGVPFIHAILQALDGLFIKYSVDPLSLAKSFFFYPETTSFIPPKCNVLFPNMYSEIDVHHNLWQEPTRSFVTLPPVCKKPNQIAAQDIGGQDKSMYNTFGIICDTADPFLAKARIATQIIEKKDSETDIDEVNKLLDRRKTVMDIVTNEEQEIGVTLNAASLPLEFVPNLNLKQRVQLADLVHSLSRLSLRSCTVMGCISDDLLVGMPILIIDGEYSILGVLDTLMYSVSGEGEYNCSIRLAYPKFIFLGDEVLAAPAFLGTTGKADIDKIGDAYEKSFGCKSIYDGFKLKVGQAIDSLIFERSDTAKIAQIVCYIINEYNKCEDKWKFVDEYRRRKEWSLEDMKIFYNLQDCNESDKDSDIKLRLKGKLFDPYQKDSEHVVVNKQARVSRYLNRVYTNTVGVTAGIVPNDILLDSDDTFAVSIKVNK